MRVRVVVLVLALVGASLSSLSGSAPVSADANEARPGSPRGAATVLSAGGGHTCALTSGRVLCWGRNNVGQLGVGTTVDVSTFATPLGNLSASAVPLGTGRTAVAIAVGVVHSCALLDNGQVKCWGDGASGRLGQGSTEDIGDVPGEMGDGLPPVALGSGRTAVAIAGGDTHTCALLDDGQVKCWGDGTFGQLGRGSTATIGNFPGQMGDSLPPVALGSGRTAVAITAGTNHTCALLDDGQVKCWGHGVFGKLGRGSTETIGDSPGEMGDGLLPVELGSGRTAVAITAGADHTCALLDDGQVKCWGAGSFGRLGQGSSVDIGDVPGEMGDGLPPIALGSGRTAIAVTSGALHNCAVLDNSQVKCWGFNNFGQLGQGSTVDRGDLPGEMGDALPQVRRESDTFAPIQVSLIVTPAASTPAAPTGVQSVGGASTAVVSWTAPSDTGGAAVTGYRIESSVDGGVTWSVAVANTGSTITSRLFGGLTSGTSVRFRVSAINSRGVGVPSLPSVAQPVGFVALAPARLLDTRPDGETVDGLYRTRTKVGAGGEVQLQVTGRGGVPDAADAVVLNVTVTDPEAAGFVTAYPCGTTRPNASNLNYTPGQVVPNNVIVKLSATGSVCLFSQQSTNLIADVNGAFTGTGYTSVAPARLLDTRPDGETVDGQFRTRSKIGAGGEIVLQVTGRGSVPVGASAVVLNVTVTDPEAAGFVTAYPCGTTRPNASNLNYTPGQVVPNNVIVKLSATGSVCLFSQQRTNLIADVNGAFTGTGYTSVAPARLLDTRLDGETVDGQFRPRTKVAAGGEIVLQVTGRGGVPDAADAVVLNVTVTDPEAAGFVTAYPCGTTRPNASNLNYTPGQVVPNNVIVKLSATGSVCLFSQQSTNLIADVNGAFTGTGYTSVAPARLLDTRPDGETVDGQFRTRSKIGAGGEIVLQVTGRGSVPVGASAVVLNVTVTDPEAAGFVTAYPCGTTRPNASNLNYTPGQVVPNNVIVKLSPTGTVCLFSQQSTNLIADVNGAFA